MKDLSYPRKLFYNILFLIIAGIFLSAIPLVLSSIGTALTPSSEDEWNEWERMAIEYLQQQEDIAQRYNDEYTFACTSSHYGYVNGEDMYDEDGELLPTDITLTIVVYKGTMASPLNRDLFLVYLLRNDDGTYYVDSYKARS